MVLLFYTTFISVDLAHHDIFGAKVGKGGINVLNGLYKVFTHNVMERLIVWSAHEIMILTT